jgi:cell division protein ZapD
MDVGARADLKTEVLKDLEKKHVLGSYRGNPAVSDVVLSMLLARSKAALRH